MDHVRVGRYRGEPAYPRLGNAGHLDRHLRRRPDDRWSDARRPHLDTQGGARPRPSDFTKIAIGYLGVGLAFFIAAASATLTIVPLLLWAAFFVVLDFSYGWAEPPIQVAGLEETRRRLSPRR